MNDLPLSLSRRTSHTEEQHISFFMKKALENKGLVSLAAGFVDAATLPVSELEIAVAELLKDPKIAQEALQYGTTQGYAPLREILAQRILAADGLRASDVAWSADDVILTSGSQQLLYLLGEVLLDPGDIVFTEAPSYFVFHGVLKSMGARTIPVPMDDEGMDVDALDQKLARLAAAGQIDRVKMIYTVDYHQNPSGRSLSLRRRKALLEIARKHEKAHPIFILEDAAYRELRYDGIDVASLHSMDPKAERVILAMTFSKPMSPGMRTGYGVLPKGLMEPVLRFKGNHDFGSSNLNQHLLHRILVDGLFDRHVEILRSSYREKRDAMLAALEQEFDATGARWTKPSGGLYVWFSCPGSLPMGLGSAIMEEALREGVLYIPGEFCHVPDEEGAIARHEARLSFGLASPEQIREGIRRLARAVRPALRSGKSPSGVVAHCRG